MDAWFAGIKRAFRKKREAAEIDFLLGLLYSAMQSENAVAVRELKQMIARRRRAHGHPSTELVVNDAVVER